MVMTVVDNRIVHERNHFGHRIPGRTSSCMKGPLIIALALLLTLGLALALPAIDEQVGNRASALAAPPVANAGLDKTVYQNTTVILNGSLSTSELGRENLTFVWTFNDSLQDVALNGMAVNYTFHIPGSYNVTLNVTDPDGNYSSDVAVVHVLYDNVPPVADAGASRRIMEGDIANTSMVLSANSSTDNVGIVNYTWYITYPGGPYFYYTSYVPFDFIKTGNWTVNLTVRDANGNQGWDQINIIIVKKPTFIEKHWMLLFIDIPIIAIVILFVLFKYRRDRAFVTSTDLEKVRLQWKNTKRTWKVFSSNRLGLLGLIILLLFAVMAIAAPWISTVPDPGNIDNLEPNLPRENWKNPLPPSLTPSPYTGLRHPFGTDHVGQDVYSSTIYGTRASLEVGMAATLISVVVGAAVGLSAGYFGRITDEVLMRMTDFFLVIPWFPLMIVMMAILGQKFIWVVVVIGITSWPSTARIVRSQVLTVKERQFIVRARAIGANDTHIMKTHIMPNVLPLIFANTVLLIAVAIFNEAFLDFFGLGDPNVISWGTMLESAYERDAFVQGAWWWIMAPGISIVLMVLAFSLVGYAIDDVLNPKLRKR